MNAFYRVTAIIIGIGFLFCSLILFAVDSVLGGVSCLLLSIGLPYMIIKTTNNKLKSKRNIECDSRTVQGEGFQFLESVYLILNTKNSKTLDGRIEFIHKIYPDFVDLCKNEKYRYDARRSISKYDDLYPEKQIETRYKSLLLSPDTEKLNELIEECKSRF